MPEGGDYWYHLLSTVSTIRSILPKNIMLLVKEHPNMFRKRQPLLGYRSSFFYKEIASLSNTYLLSHDISSPLIKIINDVSVIRRFRIIVFVKRATKAVLWMHLTGIMYSLIHSIFFKQFDLFLYNIGNYSLGKIGYHLILLIPLAFLIKPFESLITKK